MKAELGKMSVFALIGLVAVAAVASVAVAHERLRTDLTGYEEVPAISSSGRGTFRAKVSNDESEIAWTLSYAGLEADATQAHIHFGQRSVIGGIAVFLCTNVGNGPAGTQACPLREGTITGTSAAADVIGPSAQGISAGEFAELLAAIRAGVAYVNVHSELFPVGEIRGHLDRGNRGHSHHPSGHGHD